MMSASAGVSLVGMCRMVWLEVKAMRFQVSHRIREDDFALSGACVYPKERCFT